MMIILPDQPDSNTSAFSYFFFTYIILNGNFQFFFYNSFFVRRSVWSVYMNVLHSSSFISTICHHSHWSLLLVMCRIIGLNSFSYRVILFHAYIFYVWSLVAIHFYCFHCLCAYGHTSFAILWEKIYTYFTVALCMSDVHKCALAKTNEYLNLNVIETMHLTVSWQQANVHTSNTQTLKSKLIHLHISLAHLPSYSWNTKAHKHT